MIKIRMMEHRDISQIAEIERLCFSDPWSEASIASELQNELSLWLVACDEKDMVVGYIGSQTVLDGADMMNVAVHPECRRQGIGEGLVKALIEALSHRAVAFLMLEVRESNSGAIALYRKLGFYQAGLRPNYYRRPKENALILRKECKL